MARRRLLFVSGLCALGFAAASLAWMLYGVASHQVRVGVLALCLLISFSISVFVAFGQRAKDARVGAQSAG